MEQTTQDIAKEISRLLKINRAITERGGFFTKEQCENEHIVCKLHWTLRTLVGDKKAAKIWRACFK